MRIVVENLHFFSNRFPVGVEAHKRACCSVEASDKIDVVADSDRW